MAFDIPAYTNGSARGILKSDNPHSFDRTRSMALASADVILVVGTPFDFRLGYGKQLNPEARVVQIDQNYVEIGKNRDIELGLLGHAGTIFNAVIQSASGRVEKGARAKRRQWMQELRVAEEKALEKLMPLFHSENRLINPYRVAYELNEFLNDDTVYIGDGATSLRFQRRQYVRTIRANGWTRAR